MKILCTGEMLIDFTPGDTANSYIANPGGAPANVAVSVSRNGGKAGFFGKLGNDDFGHMLVDTLKSENVELVCSNLTDEAITTMAFVSLSKEGERTFTFARKPGADLLLSDKDLDMLDLTGWDYVHAGSVSQSGNPSAETVLKLLQKANKLMKTVSFDINYRDKIWSIEECKKEVEKVLPYVDILKISDEELDFTDGRENIPDFMKQYGISVVVLTLGNAGTRVFYKDEVYGFDALKVDVADTTGAGDAFFGAFLYYLMSKNVDKNSFSKEILCKAAGYAVIAGGLCVTKKGGIPSIPYKSDIENYLEKYTIGTRKNREFMLNQAKELFEFAKGFASEKGSSYYLLKDGSPEKNSPRMTWITSRMVHAYCCASLLYGGKYKELAKAGINGLLYELHDNKNGGFFAGINPDGSIVDNKQCYAHAFVILAASSGILAGVDGAKELLETAVDIFDEKFWDEEQGLTCDTWDTEFRVLSDYRGINANMHTVEAFLALADATGENKYRMRAGRIIDAVTGFAIKNNYRIPEHFTKDWEPLPDMNKDKPDDQFKPYGATPGHGIEWSRLIVQWASSTFEKSSDEFKKYLDISEKLYNRAVEDGWNSDGAEGFVYTTDWDGRPVVRDRMHWTLAEAINTSSVLYKATNNKKYADEYTVYLRYLDNRVLDKVNGSWYHQLDENNNLKETVWPGKPDIYHAFQAMLIPNYDWEKSICNAIKQEEK